VNVETRRAAAAFTLFEDADRQVQSGEAEAVIGDDGLTVGPVTVSFLDADELSAADYRIELTLWPGGKLALSKLGRRFTSFYEELQRVRNRARVAGMLAHGVTLPEVYFGVAHLGDRNELAELQVYDTHVTIVPENGDPWQLPYGAITALRAQVDPPAVLADRHDSPPVLFSHLSRHREAFQTAVEKRLDAQRQILTELTGRQGFADGMGVSMGASTDRQGLLERFTGPERVANCHHLIAMATGDPRLGFVQLLDPDSDRLRCPATLPDNWASFLIVPVGHITVVEILSGPAAATYVFRQNVDTVNRDLQLLHFRRAPLALTAVQAQLTPDNPYRLALRRLEPLQRLRASTAARILHTEGWADALRGGELDLWPLPRLSAQQLPFDARIGHQPHHGD
jgi:hypothetical protein